jgi:glycosyltransferase involved in cell wall biosynthesis
VVAAERTSRPVGAPLRVCFLSRISRKKNLDFALAVLARVTEPVVFTVYGPAEDARYWSECEQLAEHLPSNITFHYKGPMPHEQVHSELVQHDLFFLPTRGENFGHALIEAWAAGLPVLTSDQTPWRNLEAKGVGWDLSLDSEAHFAAMIDQVACWTEGAHQRSRMHCRSFISQHLHGEEEVKNNRRMFLSCANASRGDVY